MSFVMTTQIIRLEMTQRTRWEYNEKIKQGILDLWTGSFMSSLFIKHI